MDKYSLVAVSTILVIALFLTFSSVQAEEEEFDYSGMVTDINKSPKGYTFNLNADDGTIRCYSENKPNESFYKIKGEFSEDGNIFFVSSMTQIL